MTPPLDEQKTSPTSAGAAPEIARFSKALDAYPAGFSGNPLNLLFVDDATPIPSPQNYLRRRDAPAIMEERREYVVTDQGDWPFPVYAVTHRPDPLALSARLFERFDEAAVLLRTQAHIVSVVEQEVWARRPDIVALMIVDGLSYYDLPEQLDAYPYLVDGISVTGFGYRRVVGSPSISRRLFALGYKNQVGFTYFPTDPGSLANDLLAEFSPSQVVKVKEFDEVLAHLRTQRLTSSYVQISTAGLDGLCHAHRDKPPREYYLQQTLNRFHNLVEVLYSLGRSVLAYLTADHGILWRECIEGQVEIAGYLFTEDAKSPRYVRGRILRPYGRCVTSLGQNYTLLRSPVLTRNLRSNEWGVHGGISAWESIVPLVTITK